MCCAWFNSFYILRIFLKFFSTVPPITTRLCNSRSFSSYLSYSLYFSACLLQLLSLSFSFSLRVVFLSELRPCHERECSTAGAFFFSLFHIIIVVSSRSRASTFINDSFSSSVSSSSLSHHFISLCLNWSFFFNDFSYFFVSSFPFLPYISVILASRHPSLLPLLLASFSRSCPASCLHRQPLKLP